MGLSIGKYLGLTAGVNSKTIQRSTNVEQPRFSKNLISNITGERAPQVLDTVPTRDANGKPLLAGYETPTWSLVC
ncbi:hypothetical protein HDR58_07150 [bacterium]|nr:hypothetical protein [bacterium]